MSAGSYSFKIEQAATFHRTLTWKDSLNVAVDISGYSAQLQARPSKVSTDLLLDLSSEAPGMGDTFIQAITLGGAAGTIDIDLTDEETALLDWPGSARFDLILTDGSGEVTRLIEGTVSLDFATTRTV